MKKKILIILFVVTSIISFYIFVFSVFGVSMGMFDTPTTMTSLNMDALNNLSTTSHLIGLILTCIISIIGIGGILYNMRDIKLLEHKKKQTSKIIIVSIVLISIIGLIYYINFRLNINALMDEIASTLSSKDLNNLEDSLKGYLFIQYGFMIINSVLATTIIMYTQKESDKIEIEDSI